LSAEPFAAVCSSIRKIAVNEGLEDAPESLNSDPYGEHIAVIKMSNNAELEKLMNSKEYADFCEKEE
jgi:glycine cleavage system H protein